MGQQVVTPAMEENDPRLHNHGFPQTSENEGAVLAEDEPTTFHRETVHEIFARELHETGTECEPLPIGTSTLETGPNSSNLFPLRSMGTTSRGVIRVQGRYFDFIQILQRG